MAQYNPSRNAEVGLNNENSWCIYAAGFKHATEILIESVKSTYEINTVVFPILFLYRHYIELSLKEVIGYGNYLDEQSKALRDGHDLKSLWTEARACIGKHVCDVHKAELDYVEKLILDIHMIDPTSQGSRYPVVKKRRANGPAPSFSWNSPSISLDELGNKIRAVGEFLDKVTNYLAVAQDLEAQLRADSYIDSYGLDQL